MEFHINEKNKKCDEANHIINELNPDKNLTEEEFQNFMHRVTQVGKSTLDINMESLYLQENLFYFILRKNREEIGILRFKRARMWENVG